ncbi:MAG: hypothetical protein CO093_06045 [Alphaproteobacteria bacterium CG_4_9_14_3_um_filter_47_13]|nr:MAG: hypothetical protein CO093_06045 [Alphaproteobacteria bacterium CG_4_9_14_3_um_filter_47_13]
MGLRRKKKKISGRGQVIGIACFFTAIVFAPTTIVLFIGMIPTIVAALLDRSDKGAKALTVGAMNLAGCTPFLIDLWIRSHTPEMAIKIIADPLTIIVIYSAAGIGYLISWSMSGIVGTIMVQRSVSRMKDIEKRQEALVERWGQEVTGEIPIDSEGFPLETEEKISEGDENGQKKKK